MIRGPSLQRVAPAYRPMLAVMAADGLSRLGSTFTATAIPWFVLVTTGSVARTGIAVFANGLGTVLALFFGGAIVDRLSYRRASIVADLTAGLAVALVPTLYYTVGLPFALLVRLVLVEALLNTPAQVARYSALPELAEYAGLRFERANAIFDAFLTVAALLGPALAGLLIALVGASNVLWLDALSFGISALLLAVVPAALLPGAAPAGRYLTQMAGALRFVRYDVVLFPLILYFAAINLAIGPIESLLVPVYAHDVFHSARVLGLMAAVGGVGALGGNAIFGWVGHRLSRRGVFAAGFLAVPLTLGALALLPGLPATLLVLGLLGLALSVTNLLEYTIYFERIPDDQRARVLGMTGAIGFGSVPVGRLLAGALLAWLGLVHVLGVLAVVFLPVPLLILVVPAFKPLAQSVGEDGA